jgi:uridine kinase/CYTH domain-containing protein
MGTEIERRFLVTNLPEGHETFPRIRIDQFYVLNTDDSGSLTRFRRVNNGFRYYRTVKTGLGLVRDEDESAVPAEEFEQRLDSKFQIGHMVSKDRYRLPLEPGAGFLDVFLEQLNGLRIVEVEFTTEEAALAFTPPEWFGREITEDHRYNNARLAVDGVPLAYRFELEQPKRRFSNLVEHGIAMDTLTKVLERHGRALNRPVFIGIAGGSASGKTSVVTAGLRKLFGAFCTVIPMDDYYHGGVYMELRRRAGEELTWDDPEAVDLRRLSRDLAEFRKRRPVTKPVYHYEASGFDNFETVIPSEVVLVDGLFVLAPPILSHLDLRIFVKAGLLDLLTQEVVRPHYERYVAVTEANADIVFDNGYDASVESERVGL